MLPAAACSMLFLLAVVGNVTAALDVANAVLSPQPAGRQRLRLFSSVNWSASTVWRT